MAIKYHCGCLGLCISIMIGQYMAKVIGMMKIIILG